jgi:hypothetical protein
MTLNPGGEVTSRDHSRPASRPRQLFAGVAGSVTFAPALGVGHSSERTRLC